jgi:hypothetical protein
MMSDVIEKTFEVSWGDVNCDGHLRTTRYLEYASYARISYFHSTGFPVSRMDQLGLGIVVLAEASVVDIRLDDRDGGLTLSVRDDGIGGRRPPPRLRHHRPQRPGRGTRRNNLGPQPARPRNDPARRISSQAPQIAPGQVAAEPTMISP